jgi:hypothetical protein
MAEMGRYATAAGMKSPFSFRWGVLKKAREGEAFLGKAYGRSEHVHCFFMLIGFLSLYYFLWKKGIRVMKKIASVLLFACLLSACSFMGSRRYKPPTAENMIERSQEQCEMLGYDVASREFRDCSTNIYNKMLEGKYSAL